MNPATAAASNGVVVAVKPGSFALGLGGRDVLAFDLEGRLFSAYLEGRTFRRGLSGRVIEKGRPAGAGRGERWSRECDATERTALYEMVHEKVAVARCAQRSEEARIIGGDCERVTVLLDRALSWTPERLEGERDRFAAIYRHVGILPPDQYLSVVLQATEGCAWNHCTFCGFYRGQRYHVKTAAEFLAHARAVRDLLGEGVHMRRSVFLGEANAIGAPIARLLAFMDVVRALFPPDWEVHSFLDVFTRKKSPEDLRALASRGLRRVIIGLETGSAELLAFVRKPASPADALEVVGRLKASGIAVAVVVLVGLGGVRYFDEHVKKTVAMVRAMELGAGDIVYFSPLAEAEGAEYGALAKTAGVGCLSAEEVRMQETIMREGLRPAEGGPRLARYDVREFIY